MVQHERYLAVAFAALTVFILGMWNPKCLQNKKQVTSAVEGHPNYLLLALLAFMVGALCVWSQHQQKSGSPMFDLS